MLTINGLTFNSYPQFRLYLNKLDDLKVGRIILPDNSILYFTEVNNKFIDFMKKIYGIDLSIYNEYEYGKTNPWKTFSYYYNQIEEDINDRLRIVKLGLFYKNEFLLSRCIRSIDFLYKDSLLLKNSKNRVDYISTLLIS